MRIDMEIQKDVVAALRWEPSLRDDDIAVGVRDGVVTLAGFVDSYADKWTAERAVRYLTGIQGVSNLITVRPRPTPSDVKQRIRQALERGADFDAERITVEVQGNKAILRGTVRSYAEMRDAERAARNAPGVTEVENKLTVDPGVYVDV